LKHHVQKNALFSLEVRHKTVFCNQFFKPLNYIVWLLKRKPNCMINILAL